MEKIVIVAYTLGVILVESTPVEPVNDNQVTFDNANKQIAFDNSMNDFTQNFLAAASKKEGENFVFSPFSLHSALAMLTTGSTDNSETQEELLQVFGRTQNIKKLEEMYARYIKNFKGTDVEKNFVFGNKIWTSYNDSEIEDEFEDKIINLYGAEIDKFAEKNPENEINDWVKKWTYGKIDKIIDSVDNNAAMIIVNALFFQGAWASKFNEGRKQFFIKPDGKKVLTPMITRDSTKQTAAAFNTEGRDGGTYLNLVRNVQFIYAKLKNAFKNILNIRSAGHEGFNSNCIALAIPYEVPDQKFGGDIGRFEMVIVMPDHHQGLDFLDFEHADELHHTKNNIITSALAALDQNRNSSESRIINMPEFKVDSNIKAKAILQEMGIKKAFDQGDFEGIKKNEALTVSDVKHRATIEVTKDGTVGAAATSIELVSLSAPVSLPKEININKPFLFFVRDTESNAIIFAGKFANPEV